MQLSALPGIRFHRLDTYTLLNAIVANAQAYGFANVTEACVRPNVAPFTCQRPDEYLFWDGIHPSRATHTIVATAAAQLLGW
jgi:phospholipase/lecithinase/hemolysin